MSYQPPAAPTASPQQQQHMMYSRSTGALHNRLRPQNDNVTASTSTLGGLNTMRPKNTSSSLQNLMVTSDTAPLPHPTKATNLRNDSSMASLGTMPKTLSTSHSAHVLAGRTAKSTTNGGEDDGLALTWTNDDLPKETADFSFNPAMQLTSPAKHADEDGVDRSSFITVPKNSFLSSLKLNQRQLYDLYKVPHTFFYLRVRENVLVDSNSTNSSSKIAINDFLHDGRGSAGSVYDLELVSLDLVDKVNYFTLSKEGVTQFRNKVSTFTGLAQWEREYRLFHKIAGINFFRVYKRWKVGYDCECSCIEPVLRLIGLFGLLLCRHSLFGERLYVTTRWVKLRTALKPICLSSIHL
jgi:hypothetical protein